jgi:hypothetical protein
MSLDARSKIPPGPEFVPPALARPTRAFKLHAWLATFAFAAFVAVYLGLTFWLGAMVYRFLRDGIKENILIGLLEAFVPRSCSSSSCAASSPSNARRT